MKIGDRLRRAMQRAGLSQKRLAEKAQIDEGTISALMRGETQNPNWDTVERLVDAIDTTWGDLFEEPRIHLTVKDAALSAEFRDFLDRMIAADAAEKRRRREQSGGEIHDTAEEGGADEVAELPDERIPEKYDRVGARRAFRVLGQSMENVGLWPGTVIYARPSSHFDAADGKIAIVRLNKKLFLRRVDRRGNQTVLVSENSPRYGEITVRENDACQLVAIVVD